LVGIVLTASAREALAQVFEWNFPTKESSGTVYNPGIQQNNLTVHFNRNPIVEYF